MAGLKLHGPSTRYVSSVREDWLVLFQTGKAADGSDVIARLEVRPTALSLTNRLDAAFFSRQRRPISGQGITARPLRAARFGSMARKWRAP
jgi:hypothetical protein